MNGQIEALERQRTIFQAEVEKADSELKRQAFEDEIDKVDAKIAKLREQTAIVEESIQTAQAAVMDEFERIEVEGQVYSLRDFTINEQFAQVLSYWIQLKVGEVAQQYSAQAQSYKQENETLIDLMDERDATIYALRAENDRIGLQLADLQTKLDAAADRTFEAEEENQRLTSELKKLRDNTAPKATNVTGNLGEMMKAALNSRPAIYNYVNHGFNKNSAVLAETGEAITFVDIEKGKYRIITEEEALQFRTTTAEVEEVAVPNISLADSVEPPPFQSEHEALSTVLDHAVAGIFADAKVPEETGSIEERLARLEAAVFGK